MEKMQFDYEEQTIIADPKKYLEIASASIVLFKPFDRLELGHALSFA